MGRGKKDSAGPSAMEVEKKAGREDGPSDFEGDSGVSLVEDVGGAEAASPSRPTRKGKEKVQEPTQEPEAQAGKRKASPVSDIEEEAQAVGELDTEEDMQIVVPAPAAKKKAKAVEEGVFWSGNPVPKDQAKKFWPHRYGTKAALEKARGDHLAVAHYESATVDGIEISLGDCVSVQGPEEDYLAIVYELFESPSYDKVFRARWFWRVQDTVLRDVGAIKGGRIHHKMVLVSDWSNGDDNDNPLACIKSKLDVVYVPPADVAAGAPVPECDFWYNSYWCISYNTIQHTPGPLTGINPLHPKSTPPKMHTYKGHSPAAQVAGPINKFVVPTPTEVARPAAPVVVEPTKPAREKNAKGKGPASKAADEAGPSSDPGPSTQARAAEEDSPSKVKVVGLEGRPLEPTPSKKTASLTELSGGAKPNVPKSKAGDGPEKLSRKAKLETAAPATPPPAGRSTRRRPLAFPSKPSPKKGELGSAEKPVALDSEDEMEEDVAPTKTTSQTFPAAEVASTSSAPNVATVAAKIGAAVEAAVEGAVAVKEAVGDPGPSSVEVTTTTTVKATLAIPAEEPSAPVKSVVESEVEVEAEIAGPEETTEAPNLDHFLDGHTFPEPKESITILDMYAGCGGMSTGLGVGLGKAGVHLEPKWAVDMMECAAQTYKLNHPDTHVRNESAENFFMVCIEWLRLKKMYVDGDMKYELPQDLIDIIRTTYVPNYRLSAEEIPIESLENDAAFESVFVEEEVLDEDLASEEGKKKRARKAPAAKAATEAVKPAQTKSKTSKADPMTGRGGEPPKSEALQMFTHVIPADAKGKAKVVEEEVTAAEGVTAVEGGSPAKPIVLLSEEENETGKKRKRQAKAEVPRKKGERCSGREKKDIDYSLETPIFEVEEKGRKPKKAKAPAKVAIKGKKLLDENDDEEVDEDVYEVEYVYGIRWHRDREANFRGLQYRIRWKGYTEEWDTWEPEELTDGCPDLLKEFVQRGVEQQILPLPGSVGLICGGPPCQGASGFNRFRNKDEPLMDPRNKQVIVFMDIAKLLKPRYVLMENVVDILKFEEGILGRYAIRRLVNMGYQSRVGLLVAGSFGVPQFRMRTFVWGAAPGEVLPPYPLPTHMVETVRNHVPQDWTHSMVAYDEETHEAANLANALVLGDALRDLPEITNNERRDVIPYTGTPDCDFQRQMRRPPPGKKMDASYLVVNDHHSLIMNEDDLARSALIPKKKGANFRDLPGVQTLLDKTVVRVSRPLLASGKPIVPDYAITFIKGRSFKPFGRLWWDETVATVVTRAEPHNQRVLHPAQDRVLSIRENARLQGFPDHYKLTGIHPKNKYTLVGNAVAMPVGEALGKAMALSIFKDWDGSQPLCKVTPWTQ